MQQPVVWLVEDETSIADTLIYMLQQEGFAVKAFERGLPVLEEARRQIPALAILDVGLPDISGFELCRQLLAQPWSHWRDTLLAELATAHPDLAAKATRLELTRYGHAMAIPIPSNSGQIGLWPLQNMRKQLLY